LSSSIQATTRSIDRSTVSPAFSPGSAISK